MAIVRFKVGEDEERSIVRLNQKMHANFDLIPPGASAPLMKPRSIDDVPILALTFHSSPLRRLRTPRALPRRCTTPSSRSDDVSEVAMLGGQRRELKVTLDAARLAAYQPRAAPGDGRSSGSSNRDLPAGRIDRAQHRRSCSKPAMFLSDADDVEPVVVGAPDGRPVYLRDVATVERHGRGALQYVQYRREQGRFEPAVTLSIAKRKGTNAIAVADNVLQRVEALKGSLIPADVEVTITRNYGETAAEKSNELLFHMGIAVVSVSLLIAFVLGFRESLIVFTAIPVTLALTLTVFYLYGYTLNRITLFALIFSIGILVDDAIVVVENIVRHTHLPAQSRTAAGRVAVEAVDEVGNPTILATLTVIAAILPMAFVGGLMGPYMRPIPIGSHRRDGVLADRRVPRHAVGRRPPAEARPRSHGHDHSEDRMTRSTAGAWTALLHVPVLRYGFLALVTVLLLGSMALVHVEFVKVKMLPFDNKSEFQVIVDMPEGTTLEETARVTRHWPRQTFEQPEVVNVQTYAGTAAPYNFNGLVRHYFLRRGRQHGRHPGEPPRQGRARPARATRSPSRSASA